jgi:hypothetical protein
MKEMHRELYHNTYLCYGDRIEMFASRSRYVSIDVSHILKLIDVPSLLLLFSWRYNSSWLYFHSPVAGFSFLVFEVS